MPNIHDIKTGNIVAYEGSKSFPPIRFAVVDDIQPNRAETQSMYSLHDLNDPQKKVTAAISEISVAMLTDEILNRLTFVFYKDLIQYQTLQLINKSFAFYKSDGQVDLVAKMYRTLPAGSKMEFKTKEDLYEKTTELPYLNSLQNYCSENDVQLQIDFLKGL